MVSTKRDDWPRMASFFFLIFIVVIGFSAVFASAEDLEKLEGDWQRSDHGEVLEFEREVVVSSVRNEQQLAILVETPRYRAQVYWNGEWIGGTWDSVPMEGRAPPGTNIVAAIPMDDATEGSHALRIVVRDEFGTPGPGGDLFIGSLSEIENTANFQRNLNILMPLVNAGVALCSLMLSVFWSNRRDLFWLGSTSVFTLIAGLVASELWWSLSDDHGLRLQTQLALRVLIAISALLMFSWFSRIRPARVDIGLVGSGLFVVLLIGSNDLRGASGLYLEIFFGIVMCLVWLRSSFLVVDQLRTRRLEASLMFVGLMMCVFAIFCDLLYFWGILSTTGPLPVFNVLFCLVCFTALVSRFGEGSERYDKLIDLAEDAILVVDEDCRIWEANPTARRFLGNWEPGDSLPLRLPERHQDRCRAHIVGAEPGRRIEFEFGLGDIEVVMESVAVDLPDGRISMTLRDISSRRSMEAGLLHAARMETVGALAGGIAHDFNNTMTALLGQVGILQTQTEASKREPLRRMESIILTASRMMQRLMAVSRGSVETHEPVDLVALIHESVELLDALLAGTIEVVVEVREDRFFVVGSRTDLEQVLFNLVMNAKDGLGSNGGRIWIELRRSPDEENMIDLILEDSGPGIPPDIRAEIWKPFFTTKTMGRGSGLGLGVVARVVRDHGGGVALEPPVRAKGARFRITLPGSQNPTATGSVSMQDKRVLVVEDDEDIRRNICGIMRDLGCMVKDFGDAEQALRYARGAPVDLLMTDAILPGVSGFVLARELQKQQPGMRVMIISAYLPQNVVQLDVDWYCIAKPFSRPRLERAVRRAVRDTNQGVSQTKS